MSEESVYMLWDCVDCGHAGIPCSPHHRVCPSCGHARTFVEFDEAYLPGTNETWDQQNHHAIAPADLARLMAAGASWFCTNCTGDNYGDEATCFHCGASRKASDAELREALDYRTYQAYMDGDRGATADLVAQFGEYAGMRAAAGETFNMKSTHAGQLERANEGRSAFQSEMEAERGHAERPHWDERDMASSVESMERTHPTERDGPRPRRSLRNSRLVRFGAAGAILLPTAGVGGVIWGAQTHEVEGEVASISWERHIQEERWTPVVKEDWRMALTEGAEVKPRGGSGEVAGVAIESCSPRHHHDEQYVCGTKQVACTHMESYTESYSCTEKVSRTESYSCSKSESYRCGEDCTTKRGANGIATRSCSPRMCSRSVSSTCTRTVYDSVPSTCTRTSRRPIHSSDTVDKYCSRPIMKPWCSYATQEWRASDRHSASGTTRPVRWPEGSLGPLEREHREQHYEVVMSFVDDEGEVHEETQEMTFEEFERHEVGEPVIFSVTNFGTVEDVYLPEDRPAE